METEARSQGELKDTMAERDGLRVEMSKGAELNGELHVELLSRA